MKICKHEDCNNTVREGRLICTRCMSLLNNYGITAPEASKLLEDQDNKCGSCNKPISFDGNAGQKHNSACVDHVDNPFKIRGILCAHCNRGIGLLGDTEEGVSLALEYLRSANNVDI